MAISSITDCSLKTIRNRVGLLLDLHKGGQIDELEQTKHLILPPVFVYHPFTKQNLEFAALFSGRRRIRDEEDVGIGEEKVVRPDTPLAFINSGSFLPEPQSN
jgi:hypothetical protein